MKETGDRTKTIIASTASPFKFGRSVLCALGFNIEEYDDFEIIEKLSEVTEVKIPEPVKQLKDKKIIHKNICSRDGMKFEVEKFLGVNTNG